MAMLRTAVRQLFRAPVSSVAAFHSGKGPFKAQPAYENPTTATDELCDEEIFNDQHLQMRSTLNRIIEKDINPYVDEWEKEGQFPAHQVFKKLGDAGLLGVTKPVDYGGLGLDYSYSVALAEELGNLGHERINH